MADCKFILGFALILLGAYDAYASDPVVGVPPVTPAPGAATPAAPSTTTAKVSSQVIFKYDYNVSSTNLTEGSADYDKVKSDFEAALLKEIRDNIGDAVKGVKITEMSEDTKLFLLTIDIEIELDEEKCPNYELEVKDEMKRLMNNGGNLTVNGDLIETMGVSMPALDLTMYVSDVTLEVGLVKPLEVECMYRKTNKSEVIAINNIKLLHQNSSKAKWVDIASIYDNSIFENKPFNPIEVNKFKTLGAVITGQLTKNSNGDTSIKYKWTYPKVDVVGKFKCVVQWSNKLSEAGQFEKTQEIKKTVAHLNNVIEKVVTIDKSLDALKKEVNGIDLRGLHRMNKIIKKDFQFGESTYLLAKNLWGNTVSAQTLCQMNGAYLVEVESEREWAAIKVVMEDEPGPVLAGATNKQDLQTWEFMRGSKKPVFLDWSSNAEIGSTDKRCLAFDQSRRHKIATFKMINVECSSMMYETFICEMPTLMKK